MKSTQDRQWHVHDTALLWLMDSGLFGVRTDQKSVVLSKSMMIYMPAYMPHYEKLMGTLVDGWLVTIPIQYTSLLPTDFSVLEGTDLLVALCKRIVSWEKIEKHSADEARLAQVFLDELKNAREAAHLCIPFPKRASLRLIAKKIMSHPEDMNEVGHWAKTAGMSKRSFSRIFSEETGLCFVLWRQRVK